MIAAARANVAAEVALSIVLLVLVIGSVAAWVFLIRRLARGESPLPFVPRSDVPWTLLDLVIAGAVWFALMNLAHWGLCGLLGAPFNVPLDEMTPESIVALLLGTATGALGTVVIMCVVVRLRVGATTHDLGLESPSWMYDIGLGLAGMAAAFLPTYGVQWLLVTYLVDRKEVQIHPVVEMFTTAPTVLTTTVAIFTALVAAPIGEEFFFRLLLQGWLEKMSRRIDNTIEDESPAVVDVPNVDPPADGATQAAAHWSAVNGSLAVSPTAVATLAPPIPAPKVHTRDWPMATIAIVLSAGSFGLVHASVWPTPISIFFLGLVLGYVYFRTHRLLPCIVIHMAFNALSIAVMAVQMLTGEQK